MSSAKRRLNYTGRKKIRLTDINIQTYESETDDTILASVILDLERYKFAEDAKIILEAFAGSSTQRFDCGTVGQPNIPKALEINSISHAGSVNFRIKVVDVSGVPGLLLGFAKVQPGNKEKSDEQRSLFPVKFSDISPEIWRVESSESEQPTLIINNKIPEAEFKLGNSSIMQAMLLPAAFQRVLDELIKYEMVDDNDQPEWQEDWLEFCSDTLGMEQVNGMSEEQLEMWKNDAVREFCRVSGFIENLQKNMGE